MPLEAETGHPTPTLSPAEQRALKLYDTLRELQVQLALLRARQEYAPGQRVHRQASRMRAVLTMARLSLGNQWFRAGWLAGTSPRRKSRPRSSKRGSGKRVDHRAHSEGRP